jgi:hypothetical protein
MSRAVAGSARSSSGNMNRLDEPCLRDRDARDRFDPRDERLRRTLQVGEDSEKRCVV